MFRLRKKLNEIMHEKPGMVSETSYRVILDKRKLNLEESLVLRKSYGNVYFK